MKRLFSVAPGEIHEHPPDLPADAALIPLGPVEGWEAYAVDFTRSDGRNVVGPFAPVVERDSYGRPFIVAGSRSMNDDQFWFVNGSGFCSGEARRPGPKWHQSGTTLRFVRKPAAGGDASDPYERRFM